MSDLYQRIYEVVRQVPEGSVASYGQIAKLVDTSARQVGYAMAALPDGSDVPWQRIVNSKGEISLRSSNDGHNYQRILLEEEGIEFDLKGKIDLGKYAWGKTAEIDSNDLFFEQQSDV